MLAEHDVLSVGPDVRAKVHFAVVRLVQLATWPVDHRGAGLLLRIVARLFGRAGYVVVAPIGGAKLKIGLYDAYWLALLMRDPAYEPETARMLDLVLDADTLFVDCGANIGWWSAIAARRISTPGRVIAIEASGSVFARLKENADLNGGVFRPIHGAVWNTPGARLVIATDVARHAWASVDPEVRRLLRSSGFEEEDVTSVTVDDVVREASPGFRRVVLKLDVEGVERQAIDGATGLLGGDVAVIYEDHGRDGSNAISADLLARGMDLFGWTAAGVPQRVRDLPAVSAWKTSRRRGYNFLACRPGTPSHALVSSACERAH
jgi:FkbM family methyltransferase